MRVPETPVQQQATRFVASQRTTYDRLRARHHLDSAPGAASGESVPDGPQRAFAATLARVSGDAPEIVTGARPVVAARSGPASGEGDVPKFEVLKAILESIPGMVDIAGPPTVRGQPLPPRPTPAQVAPLRPASREPPAEPAHGHAAAQSPQPAAAVAVTGPSVVAELRARARAVSPTVARVDTAGAARDVVDGAAGLRRIGAYVAMAHAADPAGSHSSVDWAV